MSEGLNSSCMRRLLPCAMPPVVPATRGLCSSMTNYKRPICGPPLRHRRLRRQRHRALAADSPAWSASKSSLHADEEDDEQDLTGDRQEPPARPASNGPEHLHPVQASTAGIVPPISSLKSIEVNRMAGLSVAMILKGEVWPGRIGL